MKKCHIFIDPFACSRMRFVSNFPAAEMGHDDWQFVLFGKMAQCGIPIIVGYIEYEKCADSPFLYR